MGLIKQPTFEEEIIEHMRAKYGEEFIKTFKVIGTGYEHMFAEHQEARGVTTLYPGEIIDIEGYPKKYYKNSEDKYMKYKSKRYTSITDDYITIAREKEFNSYVQQYLEGIYNKMKICGIGLHRSQYGGGISNKYDLNTSVEEIIHGDLNGIGLVTEDELDDTRDEKIQKVIEILETIHEDVYISIYYCKDIDDRKSVYYEGYYAGKRAGKEVMWDL